MRPPWRAYRFAYITGADGSDDSRGAASLAASLAGAPGAQRTRIVASYQITVRFRDGSRHLFNEVTGRTLQSGERVQVIAGADEPLP